MTARTPTTKYQDRIKTLKRRRDFLNSRLADYQGKDMSRDKAEASAIAWAIVVIETNFQSATDLIAEEIAARREQS